MAKDSQSLAANQKVTKRQAEGVRAAIRATQIANRLQSHVFGEIELTQTQIRAAEILLDRVVPRLQAITVDPTAGMLDLATVLAQARNRVIDMGTVDRIDSLQHSDGIDSLPVPGYATNIPIEAHAEGEGEGLGTEPPPVCE